MSHQATLHVPDAMNTLVTSAVNIAVNKPTLHPESRRKQIGFGEYEEPNIVGVDTKEFAFTNVRQNEVLKHA